MKLFMFVEPLVYLVSTILSVLSGDFREEIETPFSHGIIMGGSMVIQRFLPLDVLSRLRLCYLSAIDVELREAFSLETKMIEVKVTTRMLVSFIL